MSDTQILSISEKLKEAGKHTIIYGMGSVLQSASTLVILPILTGTLSKEGFGAYSMILMATGIASAIFYFGMTSALPRSYFDYESINDRRAVFTTAFVVLLVGAFLQSLFGFLFAAQISDLLIGSPQYADAVCFALVGGAVSFINVYFFGYLRLLRKSIASVFLSLISLAGTVGLTLYLLSINQFSVVAPFEAITYAQIIIALCFLAIYGRFAFIFRLNLTELPNLLHFGATSIVASFGGLLIESIDRLMIQHFMDLADVGTFSASARVGMLINVIFITPFTLIWSPMMMEYRSRNNIGELFSKVFSLFVMLGGGGVIVGSLFASELLPIFVKTERNAATIYIFLTCLVGSLIYGVTNFVSAGLFFERKVYLLPYAYYGIALLKFLLNLVLIPYLGLVGASVSVFLSYLMVPVGVYALAKKYFAFNMELDRLSKFITLIIPCLLYGYYSSFNPSINIILRFFWLLLTIIFAWRYCLYREERIYIKSLLPKWMFTV